MNPSTQNSSGTSSETVVALVVLHQAGRYLMQLRDDKPDIVYPGVWAFFGGHVEPGETLMEGALRELSEELGFQPRRLQSIGELKLANVSRNYFYGELTVPIETLRLNEGQDMALCSPADIRRGDRYSARIDEVRPMGEPHRAVLMQLLDGAEQLQLRGLGR